MRHSARALLTAFSFTILAAGCSEPDAMGPPEVDGGELLAPLSSDGGVTSASAFSTSGTAALAAEGVTISTIASGGLLTIPVGIALDHNGDFIVPNPTWPALLLRVTPAGVVTEIRGGLPFRNPNGVTVDDAGNYIVTDELADRLFSVTPAGVVTELYSGPAFTVPSGVAIDAGGDYIVSNFNPGQLFRVTPAKSLSTIASGAPFSNISGAINDGSGNFIVVGCNPGGVFRVSPGGDVTTLVSGLADCLYNVPAMAPNGDVIATSFGGAVLRVTPDGVVSTVYSGAPLHSPNGVVLSGLDLIVSDRGARSLFRISGAIQEVQQIPEDVHPIDEVIDEVQDLVDTGVLTQDQADGLIDKLNSLREALDAGKKCQPINGKFGAFTNQIDAFLKATDLTEEKAQELIDAVQELVSEVCP